MGVSKNKHYSIVKYNCFHKMLDKDEIVCYYSVSYCDT